MRSWQFLNPGDQAFAWGNDDVLQKAYRMFIGINYILYICNDPETVEILNRISNRLGAVRTKCCGRTSQALAELQSLPLPELIIEDVQIVEQDSFFSTIQEGNPSSNFIPIPVFSLVSPLNQQDIKIIQKENNIGYSVKPLSETLIEQKIRSIYHDSYKYEKANALPEIIEQYLEKNDIQSAYRYLLPALCRKPKNVNYHLLHAKISFEKHNYILAEKIIHFILDYEPDNLSAKNILSKILIMTERYHEGEHL